MGAFAHVFCTTFLGAAWARDAVLGAAWAAVFGAAWAWAAVLGAAWADVLGAASAVLRASAAAWAAFAAGGLCGRARRAWLWRPHVSENLF